MTTLKISDEDYNFCKSMNLKFSEVFKQAIHERRAIANDITLGNVQEERRKKENFIKLADERLKFIEDKGLIEEFLNKPKEEDIPIIQNETTEKEILEKWRDDINKETPRNE